MKLTKIAFAAAAALLAPAVMATTIPGLYNTGAGIANDALDTHYALTVTQGTTVAGANGYAADQVGFPDGGPWLAADGLSKWLTPAQDEAASFDPSIAGIYKWSLTFDLTGFNLASASLSGQWAADNNGYILLNGVALGSGAISGSNGFDHWTSFSASNGFLAGINTLEFVVTNLAQNGGNPTGVRVEFLQSNANAIPEPESYALLLGSFGILGAVSRRRQRK